MDAHDHPRHDAHDHGHVHEAGWWSRARHEVAHLVRPHSHEARDKVDPVVETSREGMRTLWLSLGILGATAIVQAVIVAVSGSVALLGDTIHNAADALTALPLGVAFVLGRRAANRRYTYGYGRAEDLAGIAIVLTIAASSALAAYEAVDRLLNPRDITHLWAVAVAAAVGFAGNESVARYRIATGRRIGSAALVADGLHARTDGFTSLAVLLGAGGAAIGWRWADPVVGLLITAAILLVLRDAAREVYRRLMDAVDPGLVDTAEAALRDVGGVLDVGQVRMRWIGHTLRAEAEIVVDPHLTVVAAHQRAVAAEHALIHAVPRLTAATVHTDHLPHGNDPHAPLAHHQDAPLPAGEHSRDAAPHRGGLSRQRGPAPDARPAAFPG
ncbi:cation diffusion facilitator family transporter [Actinacidiphila bryophytorum]|uniref:Cation diffusion facilitator family transporter n=1 Tax=Actinacidiphila bryophytorum TaxID=1436133 RepID=A0A9W4E6P4_9ACTN|nr:cation diffusion facilitator family transporter [Actinacidiphila bryophytorum]MBM9440921.1 cation transporter [Actinacidiphila bryophytorum]MBN6546442.1 cation transporter [Actinacidiphila bryophytorum]CAG7623745.1 Cation diffusion facilitator family transporter [Actinacidiphila bryophytorum]